MVHPLLEFGEHMMSADGPIECGETWSLEHGWRAYIRAGTKAIMMQPRAMRKLGETYRDHVAAPPEVRELGQTLIECAKAAKRKNDRGELPADAVAFVPYKGTA